MQVFHLEVNGYTNTGEYVRKLSLSIGQDHSVSSIRVFTSQENSHGAYGLGVFRSYGSSGRFRKLFWYVYGWFALSRVLWQVKEPVIFHVHWLKLAIIDNFFLGLLKRKRGISIVFTVHNLLPHERMPFDRFFYKKIYRKMDCLIFHTTQNQKDFDHLFPDIQLVRSIVPHYSYDVVPEIPAVRDKVRFLFFGAIRPYKGLPIMLEALSKLSDEYNWDVTIAGKVETSIDELKLMSQSDLRLKGKVLWNTGWIEEEELDQLFRQAHVVILPYLRIDNSGLVHLAMSYGKTVVVPKIGAFLDLIEDGINGYFFQAGSPESLKAVLEQVVTESAFQEVGARAIKSMANRSLPVIGKMLVDVYHKVIK